METLACPKCNESIPTDGYKEYQCPKCGCKFTLKQITAEEMKALRPGPIFHKDGIPAELQDQVRKTYDVVGKYVCETFEQWELGFMHDLNMAGEIQVWVRIALAFTRYHQERKLEVRDKETESNLVAQFISLSTGVEPEDDEQRFLLECYKNPTNSGS